MSLSIANSEMNKKKFASLTDCVIEKHAATLINSTPLTSVGEKSITKESTTVVKLIFY